MEKCNQEDLSSSFRGLKAMVVDGKPVRAAVTRYHLKRLGILTEVASSIKEAAGSHGKNGALTSGNKFQPDIVLVEKDTWNFGEDVTSSIWLGDRKPNGHIVKLPKMILLATNVSAAELEKVKAAGFADTVIMKPLRPSMVAACLQQVLGTGKKRPQEREGPNGSSNLKSLLYGKKILVVDDNKVNLRVAAGALKKFGAVVECADNGKMALKLLELPHKFDACFMDIQMPVMDGFEVTRHIRKMETDANLDNKDDSNVEEGTGRRREGHMPILAMTADVIHATYEECLKCGMDGYVSKPFEEENLYQAVANFFKDEAMLGS